MIPTLQTALEWPDAPRAPVACRITCRVCGLSALTDINNAGLLCAPCRIDLVVTRTHVETVLATCEARWRAAYEAFEAQAAQEPRWAAVQEARSSAEPALFALAWERRKAEGGAFGALLVARESLDALSDALGRRREWARRAMDAIDAAEEG